MVTYRMPAEILTDKGRQHASWHSKMRFQTVQSKTRAHHIRSEPHHPMTPGRIERFWKTI